MFLQDKEFDRKLDSCIKKRKLDCDNNNYSNKNNISNFNNISTIKYVNEINMNNNNLGGTLVVAPMTLMSQWADEFINKCVSNSLSVSIYYGPNRNTSIKHLLKFDIIITSYGILTTEMRQILNKNDTYININDVTNEFNNNNNEIINHLKGLFALKWNRIVLDEVTKFLFILFSFATLIIIIII